MPSRCATVRRRLRRPHPHTQSRAYRSFYSLVCTLATCLTLQAVEAALTRILTPKRSIDVLREVKAAQVGG